jgi:hypothetical protein
MFRKLLGVVVSLGLPALLAGQTPGTPKSNPALTHARATQVLGEVVTPQDLKVEEPAGQNNDADDGQSNDVDDGQGNDVDDGQVDQEGVDEPDGLNHDDQVEEGVKDADGPNNDDEATPPAATSRSGRHRP